MAFIQTLHNEVIPANERAGVAGHNDRDRLIGYFQGILPDGNNPGSMGTILTQLGRLDATHAIIHQQLTDNQTGRAMILRELQRIENQLANLLQQANLPNNTQREKDRLLRLVRSISNYLTTLEARNANYQQLSNRDAIPATLFNTVDQRLNAITQALTPPGGAPGGGGPGGGLGRIPRRVPPPPPGGRGRIGGKKRKKSRRRKKKRKKGGYKFTRAAISRRSLRMKTRKLKSIKQKKPHKRTKHKRRRKHSKRKH